MEGRARHAACDPCGKGGIICVKRDKAFLAKLFLSTFKLSAFTFGGGYVIIPMMRRRFVEQYHWIDEEELLDMTAIAQSSPGPVAVNAAILLGYRMMGGLGALVAAFGTVLPPLIIIAVISVGYEAFRDNLYVSRALKGMQAGVAAVIFSVVLRMAFAFVKEKRWPSIALMAAALAASLWLSLNVIWILLFCGAAGVVATLIVRAKGGKQA